MCVLAAKAVAALGRGSVLAAAVAALGQRQCLSNTGEWQCLLTDTGGGRGDDGEVTCSRSSKGSKGSKGGVSLAAKAVGSTQRQRLRV